LQAITLTTAPVFFCAGIYLCLGRIVRVYSSSLSRFDPKWYTWGFLSCDAISLTLQGAGGALAASANTDAESDAGIAVMLSGLSFQVLTLLIFSGLSLDFARRVKLRPAELNVSMRLLRESHKFKVFLYCKLGISLVTCCDDS
jgi:RTA1 like protein